MSTPVKTNQVDFSVHGVVNLRFVDPTPQAVEAFSARLGQALSPSGGGEPDIVVKFEEGFNSLDLTYVGFNSAAFNRQGFYLLDKNSGEPVAKIPFEQIGERCEISYPARAKSFPLLFDIINFTFLSKGYVPLHASAFLYQDVGILIAGWPKGGKTGAMLAFINHGAQYVGDEWVLVSRDGEEMRGIPEPVSISEWQFEHIPAFMPRVQTGRRLLFRGIHALDRLHGWLARGSLKRSFLVKSLAKAMPSFKRQLKISKSPQSLFKDQVGPLVARPEKIFLINSHSGPGIKVETSDPVELASRIVHANQYEHRDFYDYYRAFKFAFPHLQNEYLETALERQESILRRAFEGKDGYTIIHPYGEPLELLFESIQPFCLEKIQGVDYLETVAVSSY